MPDDVNAHFGMGMTFHQLKKDCAVVLYLEKTLRLAPDFKPAREALKLIQTIEKPIRGIS